MTGGVIEYALTNSAGAVFKKHIFLSPEECWDELKTVTDRGRKTLSDCPFGRTPIIRRGDWEVSREATIL